MIDGGRKWVRPVVGIAVLLIGGAAAMTWGLGDSGVGERPLRPAAQAEHVLARSDAIRGLQSSARSTSDAGSNLGPESIPQKPLKVSIQSHVQALAHSLENDPFDRLGWERQVDGTANTLGSAARSELLQMASNWSLERPERVAAVEILRALSTQFEGLESSLSGVLLADLQAISLGEHGVALATAAGRSLAYFGSHEDLRGLTQRMASGLEPGQRSLAGWALGAGAQRKVLPAFAALLNEKPSAEVVERAFCFLGTWQQLDQDLDPTSMAEVIQAALEVVRDTDLADGFRVRAFVVMAALDAPTTWQPAVDLLSAKNEPAPLQRLAAAAVADADPEFDLGGLLDRSDLSAGAQLALAEAIMERAASSNPAHLRWALLALQATVDNSDSVIEQRRAERALDR